MSAVYRKTLKQALYSPRGWVTVALFLLFTGLFVSVFNLYFGFADLSYVLLAMQLVLVALLPLLCVPVMSPDRTASEDRLLLSLPLSSVQIILGRYFALLTLFAIPTALTALLPILFSFFGTVSTAVSYIALLGYFLLGAALISIVCWISTLAKRSVPAAVISVAALLLLYFLNDLAGLLPISAPLSLALLLLLAIGIALIFGCYTKHRGLACIIGTVLSLSILAVFWIDSSLFKGLFPDLLSSISLFTRFSGFSYGHLDISGIVLYITTAVFFLFAAVQISEKRRIV